METIARAERALSAFPFPSPSAQPFVPMKTLLFLRHGKSDWDADYGRDHERPLNERGTRDAKRMGRYLADHGPLPDSVVTSTAVRARTTARLAHEAGAWTAPIAETDVLYGARLGDVLDVVHTMDEADAVVLLAGHEPTWSSAVEAFTDEGPVEMPTAALACIEFPADRWTEVDWGAGTLAWLMIPKGLPEGY